MDGRADIHDANSSHGSRLCLCTGGFFFIGGEDVRKRHRAPSLIQNSVNSPAAEAASKDERMMSMEFEKIGSAGLVVRGLLSAVECQQLIQLAEEQGFVAAAVRTPDGQKSMPLVRTNQRALLASREAAARRHERLGALPLPALEGQ